MLFAALLAACGSEPPAPADADADTDADTDGDTDTDSDSDTDSDDGVRLNQVYFAPDSAGDFVELQNAGATDQSLTGWALATSRDRSYLFAAGLTVTSGGCITLYWGPNDPCDFANEACGVGGFVNDLRDDGGDVAIYRATDLERPEGLVDYVRWGSEADYDSLEDVAARARQWPTGDSVDVSAWTEGAALQYDDSGESGEAHWAVEAAPRRCE